jgi:uncharacterized protein
VKYLSVLVFSLFAVSGIATAQQQTKQRAASPFVLGTVENIYLPQGYHKDSVYPVIYLLDGSANEDFIHIAGILQFGNMMEIFPQAILVGIANVDRKRDFTFPTTIEEDKKAYPTTGGSAKFITFIEKELQPFIQKKYKVGAEKTIIGQSLGGLLAAEILLKQPSLFTTYIIVSPSLWWDNESLLRAAPELMRGKLYDGKQVCVSVGNEHPQMVADANTLSDMLKTAPVKGLTVHHIPMPEEDHATILHRAVYKAFETLYSKTKAAKP